MTHPQIKISVFCLLIFIIVLQVVQAAPIQSLRSGGYFCGTDGTCRWFKPGDPDWLFERFTYAMGYADCPADLDTWHTKSPGSILTLYTSGTDLPPYKLYSSNSYNSGKKSTWIRDRIVELGGIEESAYMHFYDDTKIRQWVNSKWDTLLILGTYSMTIDAGDSASRVPNSYISALFVSKNTYTYPTRLSPNFANPLLRQAYKEYLTQIFNEVGDTDHWPGKTGYWDGVYFDNYSPWGMVGSSLVSGGLIVETSTNPSNLLTFTTTEYRDWGWELMKSFGREVRDTLQIADQWSVDGRKKILCYNVGLSHRDAYLDPNQAGADAINIEFGFDPVYSNNASHYRLENLHSRDSIAVLNGVTFFCPSVPRTSYGGGSTVKRLAIYNNLCFYYTARTDSTWIFMRPLPGNAYGVFYNSGFDTLAWIPAMEYDIGLPVGHYQLAQSGSSPDQGGATYKIWERDYQYAKVFIRPRDGFDAKWGASSTPITLDLGSSYRQLLTDGTLGSVVTSIDLVGAAGAIMIPVGAGDCTTPPTVPVLASPANGVTADSTQPELCCNNSTQTDCSQPIRYHFQVSTVSNFSSLTAENQSVTEGVSQTCWRVNVSLSPGDTYYWRVRATNGVSNSTWPTARTFIAPNNPPTAPSPSSPDSGATVSSAQPYVIVQNANDPDGQTLTYHFQVATNSSFTNIVAEDPAHSQGTGTTSWQVAPALNDLTTYFWRVRANDGIDYSSWSALRSLYVNQSATNTPPFAPSVNAPAVGAEISDVTPILRINNSTDLDGDPLTYRFEIYDSTFGSLLAQSSMISEGPSTTDWQVSITLDYDSKYKWRARAYDSQDWSSWMTLSYFTTAEWQNHIPTTPTPLTPSDGDTVIGSIHVLVINNSTDSDGDPLVYDFIIYSDSNLTKKVDIATFIPESQPYTFYYTTANYQDRKAYYWRARANDGHCWTNWFAPQKFWHLDMALDVHDAPTIVNPLDGETVLSNQPSLRAGLAGAADSSLFLFELTESPDFSKPFAHGTALADDSFAEWVPEKPLENSKTYFWRVRTANGDYSEQVSFIVGAPVFVSPNPFSYFDRKMVLHNLPDGSRFEVYTMLGEKVVQIDNLSGSYAWDVLNFSGEKLASGVYLYYVIIDDQRISDKFIVVR